MTKTKKAVRIGIASLSLVLIFSLFSSTVLAFGWRDRVHRARAKYQAAHQQYLKEVNWLKTFRTQLHDAQTRYKRFKNAKNRADYEERARKFLEKTVDVLIKRLESLKTWVNNRKTLSDEQKQEIISEIDKDINWLQEQKSGINSATPEQIREKAKEIRQYWRKHRYYVRKIVGQIWGARLDWAIERFENVSEKVSEKINQLKEEGYNTSKLEEWLNDFNQKVDLAKEKVNEAQEKYESISDNQDAVSLFAESKRLVIEANQYLREAHRDLVKIVREIRRILQEKTSSASSTATTTQ